MKNTKLAALIYRMIEANKMDSRTARELFKKILDTLKKGEKNGGHYEML